MIYWMNASKTVIEFLEPILSQKPLAKKMYFKHKNKLNLVKGYGDKGNSDI